MGWLLAGGAVLLYLAASMSRRRKQRIVEAALSRAVRAELSALYRSSFGTRGTPITPEEAHAMWRRYWASLLEAYDARDFASLMRAMTVHEGSSWPIEKQVVDQLVAMVPGMDRDSVAAAVEFSRIDRALTTAGEGATEAGRSSGEI